MKEQSIDEVKIQELFTNAVSAWNAGDGTAYASNFTEDVDYVTFNGQHIKGRKAVAVSHQKLFDGVMRGSKLDQEVKQIRLLSLDIAVVHCVGAVQMRWQKKVPKKRVSINTNVVIKENDEWKISAFHNCRITEFNFIQRIFMKEK